MKAGSLLENEKAEAPALVKEHDEKAEKAYWHKWIESRPTQFIALTTVLILIGGLVEMIPTYLVESNVPTIASVKP